MLLLDLFSVSHLENVVTVADLADELTEEQISDQKSIIELQQTLIKKKDVELNYVKKPVQTEIKTCSSVASRSSAAVFALNKIEPIARKLQRLLTERIDVGMLFCMAFKKKPKKL